jgi:hypothetical protein
MSVVYFWLRENQTPYYVGYGSHKNRAYATHPRKNNNFVPKPNNTKNIHFKTYPTKWKGLIREWEFINFLRPMLCNIEPGANSGTSMPGELNPFYGKTHSPETIKKISSKNKGLVRTDEFKQKRKEFMLGEKNPTRGRKRTEEEKELMSQKRKGKGTQPKSEETKKKMSEARKKFWETKRS